MMPKGTSSPRRGDIYLINFDPTVGAEIKKTRPGLILHNDIANLFSPITIVAAVTSQVAADLYPTEVRLRKGEGGLKLDSVVLLNQIRSIDKQRLVRRLGRVKPGTMDVVDRAISISLGLIDLEA